MNHHLLVTGEYWLPELSESLAKTLVPSTLIASEKLDAVAELRFTLIVLGQSRRNTIENAVVERLRADHPGVPIVVVSGSWCEGEKRSGLPLAGVNLVPVHQFGNRLARFLAQDPGDSNPIWQQPLTATESDRVRDYRVNAEAKAAIENCNLTIIGNRYEDSLAVSDMLKLYGLCPQIAEDIDCCDPSSKIICIEASGVDDDLLAKTRATRNRFPSAAIIAIAGFPRPQDRSALTQAGAGHVIAKPFLHSDLIESIRQCQHAIEHKQSSQSVRRMHSKPKSANPASKGISD